MYRMQRFSRRTAVCGGLPGGLLHPRRRPCGNRRAAFEEKGIYARGMICYTRKNSEIMNRALLIFVSILFLGSLSTNAQIQPTSLKNKIVEPFVIYEIWTGESKWDWNSKYLYHTSLAKVVIEKDTVWIDRYNEIFDAENLYLFKLDLTPGVEAVMPDDPKYIKQKKEREEKKRREQAFIDSIFIKNNIPDDFEMIYKVDGNLPYLWGRKNSKAGIIDLQ